MFYKAIVHSVLLYGRDIWLMMRAMLNVLEVFHHRSARHIVGMMVQRTASGEWEWPAVADALETAGL